MTVTVQLDDEPVTVNVAEELERMNDKLEEQFQQQAEFNSLLVGKLDQQERYIKESLEKRDQLLLESIKT